MRPRMDLERRVRDRDRLSELPDSLILTILSLLKMDEVVRTTILSKRWVDLWTTVPCLDFCLVNSNFITAALAKWKGAKILKFTISFWDPFPPSDLLDSWLLVPIIKQVEHLSIDFENVDPEYRPPQPLYSCSSLTTLYLHYSHLEIVENVNLQWNHLKSLEMGGLDFMSADAVNRILSAAPLLEELMLWYLDISENFIIQSTSLKMLKIRMYTDTEIVNVGDFKLLEISTPNLESLEISGLHTRCLLNVPSLTKAALAVDAAYYLVDLNEASRNFLREEMFRQAFLSLLHVEELTLDDLCSQFLVDEIKKGNYVLFPKLVMLKCSFSDCDDCDDYHSLTPTSIFPNLSLLQLKTLVITWYFKGTSILEFIGILLENAHALQKMVLRVPDDAILHADYDLILEKVLSMRRSSPYAKVIICKHNKVEYYGHV